MPAFLNSIRKLYLNSMNYARHEHHDFLGASAQALGNSSLKWPSPA